MSAVRSSDFVWKCDLTRNSLDTDLGVGGTTPDFCGTGCQEGFGGVFPRLARATTRHSLTDTTQNAVLLQLHPVQVVYPFLRGPSVITKAGHRLENAISAIPRILTLPRSLTSILPLHFSIPLLSKSRQWIQTPALSTRVSQG
jgi:hypothetical protein